MFFSSGSEFVFVVTFLVFQWLVRRYMNIQFRRIVLFLGNIFLLSTLLPYLTLGVHIALSALVFLTLIIISKHRNRKGTTIATLSILTLIVLFCLRNYPKAFGFESFQFGNSPEMIIQRLGISYILFRNIQSIVDTLKGRLQPENPIDYINFILFFPNFLAGPIDKFTDFKRNFTRPEGKIKRALFWPGVGRITLGFLKKYVLIPLFSAYALSYEPLLADYPAQTAVVISALCYSAYIFLDFSGYSDIAIGTGYIMGIKTPENFDSPYLTSNIADFWKKWHMTFSNFLRELIFKPIVQLINKSPLKSARTTVTILGYILTFFICGIWHGETANFIYWGLWHALGLAVYKIWSQSTLYDRLHKEGSVLKTNVVLFSGILITFAFVTIGWIFFNYEGEQLEFAFKALVGMT